ncbi:hypothetical protein U0070_018871 [Myodes glareolus]|uniref:Uncharacterized protein n=1 Tax=Myodes glareolus TaxID=447135 RepID=A0AAW0JVC4_MYOGA
MAAEQQAQFLGRADLAPPTSPLFSVFLFSSDSKKGTWIYDNPYLGTLNHNALSSVGGPLQEEWQALGTDLVLQILGAISPTRNTYRDLPPKQFVLGGWCRVSGAIAVPLDSLEGSGSVACSPLFDTKCNMDRLSQMHKLEFFKSEASTPPTPASLAELSCPFQRILSHKRKSGANTLSRPEMAPPTSSKGAEGAGVVRHSGLNLNAATKEL